MECHRGVYKLFHRIVYMFMSEHIVHTHLNATTLTNSVPSATEGPIYHYLHFVKTESESRVCSHVVLFGYTARKMSDFFSTMMF